MSRAKRQTFSGFSLLKSEDLLLFFLVKHFSKLNILGFWTVDNLKMSHCGRLFFLPFCRQID